MIYLYNRNQMAHMNKKAAILITGIGNDICSPFFDDGGKLNIVYQNSGSIKKINSVGNTQNVCNTNGHPSGACYGSDGSCNFQRIWQISNL